MQVGDFEDSSFPVSISLLTRRPSDLDTDLSALLTNEGIRGDGTACLNRPGTDASRKALRPRGPLPGLGCLVPGTFDLQPVACGCAAGADRP